MRNPSRIPCLTQAFTRHPDGLDASGSAARTFPADNSDRRRRKTSRAWSRSTDAPASNNVEISEASVFTHMTRNDVEEPSRADTALQPLLGSHSGGARRQTK